VSAQRVDRCLERTIAVTVGDGSRVIRDLPITAFQGSFRGKPVAITSAPRAGQGRIVVLLDVSGSVTGTQHKWDLARLVAGDIVSNATPGRVALLIFGDVVVERMDFTTLPSDVFSKLRELHERRKASPKGHARTALLDTALQALQLLVHPNAEDVVYAITDGGDDASHATDADVTKAFLQYGVRFFAFLLPTSTYFYTEEERLGPALLSELSAATGGVTLTTNSDVPSDKRNEQIEVSLLHLYEQMISPYFLNVELPTKVDKRRGWSLQVVDQRGIKRKDLHVFYPRELMPCSDSAIKLDD
jgi:hypothetical protein